MRLRTTSTTAQVRGKLSFVIIVVSPAVEERIQSGMEQIKNGIRRLAAAMRSV